MIKTRYKDLREDKDLTQKDFAKILNIKQQTYSNYETGKREIPIETIIKIADYHNVSLDYIYNRSNKKEISK